MQDHEERDEQESPEEHESPEQGDGEQVDAADHADGSTEVTGDAADSDAADEASADAPTDEIAAESASDEAGEAETAGEEEAEAPAEEIEIPELKQILEAAILAADKPLSIDNMISLFTEGEQPSRKQVREVLEEVEADFGDRGFELKQVASGYRFQVRERYGDWIGRLWEEKAPRYTRALLETLALIAYKQPITRGDVEDIRGVAVSTNIIRTLLEREWIRVVGHRDVPGKPAIYATTKTFLDYFNLSSLDELPTLSEIKDLEGANEELALDDEIIAPRSLDLTAGEGSEDAEAVDEDDDSDLDAVTDQVNSIQENIRNLFAEPAAEPDLDDEDDEDSGSTEAEETTAAEFTTESTAGESTAETSIAEDDAEADDDDAASSDDEDDGQSSTRDA